MLQKSRHWGSSINDNAFTLSKIDDDSANWRAGYSLPAFISAMQCSSCDSASEHIL